MTRECMGDQLIHEIRLRQSARFPQLGIHADQGESWQRVYLVHEYFVALDEEVDSGQAFAAEQPKHLNRKLLNTMGLLRGEFGGNAQSGAVSVDVFCLIRIEAGLVRRTDLAGLGCADLASGLFQDSTFILARSVQAQFDKELMVVAEREFA